MLLWRWKCQIQCGLKCLGAILYSSKLKWNTSMFRYLSQLWWRGSGEATNKVVEDTLQAVKGSLKNSLYSLSLAFCFRWCLGVSMAHYSHSVVPSQNSERETTLTLEHAALLCWLVTHIHSSHGSISSVYNSDIQWQQYFENWGASTECFVEIMNEPWECGVIHNFWSSNTSRKQKLSSSSVT